MAHAESEQAHVERRSDRRGPDRRVEQQPIIGEDRPTGERRAGRDRRG